VLVGREREREALARVLADARLGRSRALVVRGEAGLGKSALLADAVAAAAAEEFVVLQAIGAESEQSVAYAGLHALLRPLVDRLDEIPETQARTLRAALALEAGPPDRLGAYAGTLSLLAAAAESSPILVAVDDGHWLDRASAEALTFAARRLAGESIAMLVVIRAGTDSPFDSGGLEHLDLAPLSADSALELLQRRWGDALAPAVGRRLVAATGGNPLALLEVTELLTDNQRAGRDPIGETLPVTESVELGVRRRLRVLAVETRAALLVAAAGAPDGVVPLVALEPAEEAGLVTIVDGRVRFGHPLVSAAIYRLAETDERRRAHRQIADALPNEADADRRAWHLAAAASGPDESVAAALEQAADRARTRGGFAAQASALSRAAEMSADDDDRARRLVDAAAAAYWSGDSATAIRLAERAAPLARANPVLRAAAIHRLAVIADWHGEWQDRALSTDALEALASEVEPLDPLRAVGLLGVVLQRRFQALETREALALAERRLAMAAGLGEERRMRAVQDLARATGLRGEASRCEALCDEVLAEARRSGTIGFATNVAEPLIWLERYDDAREQLEASVGEARREGNLVRLSFELTNLALLELRTGAFVRALAMASEARDLASESGNDYLVACNLAVLARLAAFRGDVAEAEGHSARALEIAERLRDALIAAEVRMAQGEAALSEGRPLDAIGYLEPIRELAVRNEVGEVSVLPFHGDLVEAYVRAGREQDARAVLALLEERAVALNRRWALSMVARCRALLVAAESMDDSFQAALAGHGGDRGSPFQRARTQLVYGERLRRAQRRRDARAQLLAAIETFDALGAARWSERARQELGATGQHLPRRDLTAPERLTPQELQIALQVAAGRSNREVAEALFLSAKTVEFHLTRVYRKLDVHSRAQLILAFAPDGTSAREDRKPQLTR
jgi:DNA-binding CsgD family transcriptional regulator